MNIPSMIRQPRFEESDRHLILGLREAGLSLSDIASKWGTTVGPLCIFMKWEYGPDKRKNRARREPFTDDHESFIVEQWKYGNRLPKTMHDSMKEQFGRDFDISAIRVRMRRMSKEAA